MPHSKRGKNLTPYHGKMRLYDKFVCEICNASWGNAYLSTPDDKSCK